MKRTVWPLSLFVLVASVTASMAEEQPVICFGNEPSWRLDLTEAGKAHFSTPDSPTVDYLGAASALAPRKESVWRGHAAVPDGGELVAFLREGACSDGMSDTVHPYSVNVSLPEGRHYAGCCRVPGAPLVSATLENATWRLTGLPGQTLPAESGRNAVTVNFEAGRVHGFSGCNQFMGSYTLEGERLVLGTLGGTMRACPEPAMSIENHFLKSFSGTLNIAVAGNDLTLTPENGDDALRFEREASPTTGGRSMGGDRVQQRATGSGQSTGRHPAHPDVPGWRGFGQQRLQSLSRLVHSERKRADDPPAGDHSHGL